MRVTHRFDGCWELSQVEPHAGYSARTMQRVLRGLGWAIASGYCLLALWVNVALYTLPGPDDELEDLLGRQAALERELEFEDAGAEMQRLFPEGFIFVNVLYGLTWTQIALREDCAQACEDRSLDEARWALAQLESREGTRPFEASLCPDHGVFHAGWTNYLRASIVEAAGSESPPKERAALRDGSAAIAACFAQSETPFLESYRGMVWPADSVVAMASLGLHDALLEPRYVELRQIWVEAVRARLDGATGLVAHSSRAGDGATLQPPRGSSTALMVGFWPQIDEAFARQQLAAFEDQFEMTRFGLPAIREYPSSHSGHADVDSGPVVFGVGFSADIVAVRALRAHGRVEAARQLSAPIHAFGFQTGGREAHYLGGALPVADAFIAWSRAQAVLVSAQDAKEQRKVWWGFHLLSLLPLLAGLALWRARSREARRVHVPGPRSSRSPEAPGA